MARYLFVVAPDKQGLYQHLLRRFQGLDEVQVIVDRRHGERRRPAGDPPGAEDRRRRERRRAGVDDDLRRFGWAFLRVE